MTEETAQKVRKLLDDRNHIEKEIEMLKRITSMSGTIIESLSVNHKFVYDKGDKHITFIINGLQKEVDDINAQISRLN